jgi:hypothetical protein
MWSAKDTLRKLNAEPPFSVLRDLLGYRRARVPSRVDGTRASVSLLSWAKLDAHKSFNVNVIAVGIESFTEALWTEVDQAIHRLREIYGGEGIGVKYVQHWFITTAEADGLDVMTAEDEVNDLLDGWAVDNQAIDLYFPASWMITTGLLGRSAVDGPCPGEKDSKGKKGSCVGLTGVQTSSRTCAHEIGHYLSLTRIRRQTITPRQDRPAKCAVDLRKYFVLLHSGVLARGEAPADCSRSRMRSSFTLRARPSRRTDALGRVSINSRAIYLTQPVRKICGISSAAARENHNRLGLVESSE